MANIMQVVVQNNTAQTATDLEISGATGVYIQNAGALPVLLGTDANQLVDDGFFISGQAPGWVLGPGETTPQINLSSNQSLYAALPGAVESATSLSVKLQIVTNLHPFSV